MIPKEPKYNMPGRYLTEYINFSNFSINYDLSFNQKPIINYSNYWIKFIKINCNKQHINEIGNNIRNVSLTYLRGLEIAELKEEDMPMVS